MGSFQGAGTLPPVLDLEASGGLGVTDLRNWTATWLQTVEQLTGRTPMIYVSPAFWEHYLGNSTAFTHYPLWIAHYGVSTPRVPGGWPTWTFWQRTSSGTVSGISGNVDMNRFNGTTAQLASLANTTGGSSAPVPPGVTIPTGEPTNVTLTPSASTTTAINGPVTFAGDLRKTADSSVLAGLPVTLYARAVGGTAWSAVSTINTDPAGHYSFTTPVSQATDYSVAFAGDTVYAGSASAPSRVSTPAKLKPTVYLHKNKTSRVRKGAAVMVYGHLKTSLGAVTGKYVRFYKRPARGGRWTYVRASKSLAPTGWYSTTVRPRRSTTYKAVSIADTYRLAATSNDDVVRELRHVLRVAGEDDEIVRTREIVPGLEQLEVVVGQVFDPLAGLVEPRDEVEVHVAEAEGHAEVEEGAAQVDQWIAFDTYQESPQPSPFSSRKLYACQVLVERTTATRDCVP